MDEDIRSLEYNLNGFTFQIQVSRYGVVKVKFEDPNRYGGAYEDFLPESAAADFAQMFTQSPPNRS